MNATRFVKAKFKPAGKQVLVDVPTGEKKKGFLGFEKDVTKQEMQFHQTGWSDCEIDGDQLAADVAKETAALNQEGFEVVAVTPVISGTYKYDWSAVSHYGYGYGYSYTEGVLLIATGSHIDY
jgi:hypothetical protein